MADMVSVVCALACGLLAVTPFIWCFIFRAILSFCMFDRENDILYAWSTVIAQIIMICLCFQRYSKCLNRSLDVLCLVNVALICICFICIHFPASAHITVPLIFSVNLVLLSIWLPVTFETVYLCSGNLHTYFQFGFYIGIMTYYILLFYKSLTSYFLLVPLTAFLTLGVYAHGVLKSQESFKKGLFNCKAIFINKDNLYIRHRVGVVFSLVGAEVFLVSVLTIATIIIIMTVGLYTNVFATINTYILLCHFASLCCGGLNFPAHWATLLYCVVGSIATSLIFVLKNSIELQSCFFFLTFLCFTNAINCEFSLAHIKLSRGVNGPKIVLFLCLVVNIFISISFNVLYNLVY
ncbi:envelope protein UL43 [Vespertilionid gammaherpesvirus 1]|uniref:Envelope protein UL43 n=1 Tax=Vespertilionid gammaherpesvirus 1 TaxID=2560830 RepID=A0A0X9XGY0_9GAMA|nr:envelope protein UL43 [Myotis gammaherpesvirus 8]AMA67415.1 envelope protein UL43 [Vespertilionid gammaherpesvirus 1]